MARSPALKIREALIPFYAKLTGLLPRRWSPTNKKISEDVLKTAIGLWNKGLAYREIAERLGLPPSTIRTYLGSPDVSKYLERACKAYR